MGVLRLILVIPVVLANLDWLEKHAGNATPKPTLPPVEPTNGCGYSFNEPSRWRIVNGKTAPKHIFPWLAPLFKGSAHICAANILNRRWLLTAAHCVDGHHPFLFDVQPGDHKLGDFTDTGGRQQKYKVKAHYVHEAYIGQENSYKDDLALLQLTSDIKYSEAVQPICMPTGRQNFERNDNCFAAGWGLTLGSVAKEETKTLQYLHEKVRKWKDCKELWKYRLSENHICYGQGDPTPCNGDSGGGLMCKDGKSWHLAGIASWVWKGCDKPGYPAAYMEVSKYADWIEGIMKRVAKEEGVSVSEWQ